MSRGDVTFLRENNKFAKLASLLHRGRKVQIPSESQVTAGGKKISSTSSRVAIVFQASRVKSQSCTFCSVTTYIGVIIKCVIYLVVYFPVTKLSGVPWSCDKKKNGLGLPDHSVRCNVERRKKHVKLDLPLHENKDASVFMSITCCACLEKSP